MPGHTTLLVHFTKIMVTAFVFKSMSRNERLRKYMPPTAEAYLVVTYVNSYKSWMREFQDGKNKAEGNDYTQGDYKALKLYTNNKGSGIYKGWTAEGYALHKHVTGILKVQRDDPAVMGGVFEDALMAMFTRISPVEEAEVAVASIDDTDEFFRQRGMTSRKSSSPIEQYEV
jgi:hypothetical protein